MSTESQKATTQLIQTEHANMVRNLVKPPSEIMAVTLPSDCDRQHMFLGLVGEFGELIELFHRPYGERVDEEKLLEEAGDALFYLRHFYVLFGINKAFVSNVHWEGDKHAWVRQATINLGLLADCLKRPWIYRKEAKQPVGEVLERLHRMLSFILGQFGYTVEDALAHNMNKLYTGKNARYAEGKYTDEQANARADKIGADDHQL